MKILVACECSGRVRDAFLKLGHDAMSCDLKDTEIPGYHYKGDVKDIINNGFDLMIAHPPCTYLSVSGARWFADKGRKEKQDEAVEFVKYLMNAKINRICIENPIGIISTVIRQLYQIINPWMFGDAFCKRTCLWLKNLPFLQYINVVGKGEYYVCKSGKRVPKWYNQFSIKNRSEGRSKTFLGIANAMAKQWGILKYEKFINKRNRIFTYKSILCKKFEVYK
jgi:hypothetical protein